jgi:hypothetical protein
VKILQISQVSFIPKVPNEPKSSHWASLSLNYLRQFKWLARNTLSRAPEDTHWVSEAGGCRGRCPLASTLLYSVPKVWGYGGTELQKHIEDGVQMTCLQELPYCATNYQLLFLFLNIDFQDVCKVLCFTYNEVLRV